MIKVNYNPDVLSCLANLSNDEVFTPPKLANEILDLLPEEIWSDKSITFIDPFTKSGVFLREIAKRLMEGLETEIPDQQQRINHIFKNQLYGIAITELTSLLARRSVYCSKTANGKYSIVEGFHNEQGNIKFDRIEHTWKNGKCTFCGASQSEYDREDILESYAYEFIHTNEPENIFNMKFDVIVGNPPYQLSDGGHGRSATPVYHKFIQQAKKMNPRYLSMIIPARWYSGGRGLDNFRKEMLNDNRISKLIDFENFSEVFPGVDIAGGVCYFLWEREYKGDCEIFNVREGKKTSQKRKLDEFKIFVRNNQAISIINKINSKEKAKHQLNKVVSPSRPFGIRGFYKPTKNGIPCYFNQKTGLKFAKEEDISDRFSLLNKWKLLIPKSPIAGQTDFTKPVGFYYEGNVRIAKPGECCTETYLVAFASKSKKKVEYFKSYLFTKTIRFLLLQAVVSQDITRERFVFIPHLEDYDQEFTDELLRKRWSLSDNDWEIIDMKIKDVNDINKRK